MKRIFLLLPMLFLFSCAASYSVKTVNDQFSDPNAPTILMLENNGIINHDPLGMVPSSELNCYLSLEKKTNKIIEMGMFLIHVDGNRNLFIREGDEMIFIADSNRIVLKAKSTKADYMSSGYNTVSKRYYNYFFDFAWYPCAKEDFYKITHAKDLKFKIIGANTIREYGTDYKILGGCIENLRLFYDTNIKRFEKN